MEGNITKTNYQNIDISNAFKKKDVRKIRNIIAKYKHKTLEPTPSILYKSKITEERYFRNHINNFSNPSYIFTTNSFNVQNENEINKVEDKIPNDDMVIANAKSYNFNSQFGYDYQISTLNDMANEIKKISTNNEEFFKSSIKSEFQTDEKIFSGIKGKLEKPEDNIKKLNEYKVNLEEKIRGIKTNLNDEPVKIDYSKFKNMPLQALINLLYFFDTIDLFQLIKLNKELKEKFLDIFKEHGKKISQQFDNIYLRNLKAENTIITLDKYKRNKRGHLKISLIIKAKIISDKFKDKTITIGYKAKFPSDKEKLKNIYKFDVRPPGPLSFWVMREYTYFHQDDLNKAYFQHIMQFCIGDYIEITLNLFTEKGLLEYDSFKWAQPNIINIPSFNFLEFSNEHNKNREVLDFDLSRFCEMEIVKNKWSELIHLENSDKIVSRIKGFFEPNLLVQKILFDDVGYHLFKIFLVAHEKGKIKSDFELGISIEVIDNKITLSNEVKKNCLIFDRKNEIQVRVGDIVVFYISKNK